MGIFYFSECDASVMMLLISCADSLLNSLQSLTTEVSNLREHNLLICRENAVSHVYCSTRQSSLEFGVIIRLPNCFIILLSRNLLHKTNNSS